MAVRVPFLVWFERECRQRGTSRRSWLVRESGCSYATVRKALRGDYVGPDAACRLAAVTGGAVAPDAILQLARRSA